VISDNDFAYLTGSDMTWVSPNESKRLHERRLIDTLDLVSGWFQLAIEFSLVSSS
jgi:hypothetical protein